ncbi:uncharacterized protein [Antedon mediterranea]|uniref:uncharacterized protein n=1 Tax=Antedon mediterranea TaxID=105859 RepID=UPI003AF5FEC1
MPVKGKKSEPKEDVKEVLLSGIYIFPNGDKYEGEYCLTDDGSIERQGEGIHSSADGTCYKGQWEKDKMNGHGTLTHPGGSSYEGHFCNNQFHGRGQYTWPNGSFYEGEFNENRMEGDGSFTDTNRQVWVGTFRNRAAPGLKFKLEV